MSRRPFSPIGAPPEHRACERVDEDPTPAFPHGRTWYLCECNRTYTTHGELTAHHKLVGLLIANTITSRGKR